MKLMIFFLLIAFVGTSCDRGGDTDILCTINKDQVKIRNGNATFLVDNNIRFGISCDGKSLTDNQDDKSSLGLTDSAGNRISFTRTAAGSTKVNDQYGRGETIEIEAESSDRRIAAKILMTVYGQFPDAILVQAVFRNISGAGYNSRGYFLNQVALPTPENDPEWWSFQGVSYHWGQDFVFQLPDSFRRDNYMGMNGIKEGGGIPLVDIWNKDYGLAVGSLGDKPDDVSFPVVEVNGEIQMEIRKQFTEMILQPGDSIQTAQTVLIVHRGDFYDPLRTYAKLMNPLLPQFQESVDFAYLPEWCTWGYNQHFTQENILGRLDTLKALGIKSVILDDGWSVNHGDWIPDPAKFPGGDADFKKLVDILHEKDFKVWLWWVPGYADSFSTLVTKNPEWLIMNEDGILHPSYGLCPAYAPVQDYYQKLVRKFVADYRLDGFKLDFREINSAPPCYNPAHRHRDPRESYYSSPVLFQNICLTAKALNSRILLEYCSCGIPPNIFHLPYANLAVTSDPNISQITNRIKMYKALMGDNFPVLEEYCGVLAGPVYQLVIGTGGVPGTFSTFLDAYHVKWLEIYGKYKLSTGRYLNLYDIGFDYPEAHVIQKDDRLYYAFFTHPWKQMETPLLFRFGDEFDQRNEGKAEIEFPRDSFSGQVELRGLDPAKQYRIVDYENDGEMGTISGKKPILQVSFGNYLLLELTPVN
jgi:alpha-galactosidase